MQMNDIGDFLKSLRKSKGLTQLELADMLNVSNKTVSKWENGLGIPEMSTLLMLAEIYGVTVDDILRGSKKMPKGEDKTIERFQYMMHKSKHQYINHLILSFGCLILGVLAYFVTDALTDSAGVIITVTLAFVLALILFQIFNIVRIHYQLIEVDNNDEKNRLFRFVFHSSFYVLLVVIWLTVFMILRNAYWIDKTMNAFYYSAIIPAFAIAAILTLEAYGLTRLFVKFKFDLHLSHLQKGFIFGLIAVILFPFIVLRILPARDVAIALDWVGVNQSIFDISDQDDGYYRLKLLWLIDEAEKDGIDPADVYDIVMIPSSPSSSIPAAHYHFTEPTDYDLTIELNYFEDFLMPLGYSNFSIDDTTATAYWFNVNDTQLSFEIYGFMLNDLMKLWLAAGAFVLIALKIKKFRPSNESSMSE